MAVKLFSEYQPNVDALARRIAALTSLSSRQAQPAATFLLGRKELKIKSSSLAQIFKQIDSEVNTKQVRNEFLASGLIARIEGTGKEGKPAVYRINAEVVTPPEDDDAEGEGTEVEAVEGEGAEVEADEVESAEALKLDADESAADKVAEDEIEVEAPTAEKVSKKRKHGKKAHAEEAAAEAPESTDVSAGDSSALDEDEFERDARNADAALQAEEEHPAHAEGAVSKKPVEFVSKVGRGARVHRRRVKDADASGAQTEPKSVKSAAASEVKDAPKKKAADEVDASQHKKHGAESSNEKKKAAHKQDAQHEGSGKQAAEGKKQAQAAPAAAKKKDKQQKPAAPQGKAQKKHAAEQAEKKKAHGKNAQGKTKAKAQEAVATEPKAAPAEERKGGLAAAKAAGLKIVRAIPRPRALAKVDRIRTDIVKVETGKPAAQGSHGANGGPARKLNDDVATIMAWIDAASEREVPYASRRQRAYEVFNDEKAFEGKRGERLFRRLNEKGVNMMTLRITPSRPTHFTGFFNIGSNRPFIMVENLDTYDEIVRLLRGRKNAKLFGVRVGGVIFGGGCKAAVSHALDDYLDEIGYDYKFVYYAGDIDREGAKIVEQARAANVTEVRLHAGMYKAMLAAHRARVKEGRLTEAASCNQGVPQNLAEVIRDLPVVTRVQFRNVLRAGGRIPQEILTSSDYRDSDSGALDRALNG